MSIIPSINRQTPFAADLSPKAVQSPFSTVPKAKNVPDTTVPVAHVDLCENKMFALATLLDAMKAVCSICDPDFRLLTGSHEMETRGSPFRNIDVSKRTFRKINGPRQKANHKHEVFPVKEFIHLVKFCLEVMALVDHGQKFCA